MGRTIHFKIVCILTAITAFKAITWNLDPAIVFRIVEYILYGCLALWITLPAIRNKNKTSSESEHA